MKRSGFSDEQIIALLREQEAGMPTAEVCLQARDQIGDVLQVEGQVWRPGSVGGQAAEGARGRERAAAAYLQSTYEMSERRACRVIGTDRTSVRCRATRDDDGVLCARLTALAQERPRFGHRRLHVLLQREGHAVNKKRVQRLYREERLTVRRRGGRKRGRCWRPGGATTMRSDRTRSSDG